MKYLLSCEFNIDTACVELKYLDGSIIAIYCDAVESEVTVNMYERIWTSNPAKTLTDRTTGNY